jgi:hypothetical protein
MRFGDGCDVTTTPEAYINSTAEIECPRRRQGPGRRKLTWRIYPMHGEKRVRGEKRAGPSVAECSYKEGEMFKSTQPGPERLAASSEIRRALEQAIDLPG